MEKSNKSLLWEYFEKLPDGSGRCKTCKKQIACTSGNTTGLGRHLTSFHGNLNKVLIYLFGILLDIFNFEIFRSWKRKKVREMEPEKRGRCLPLMTTQEQRRIYRNLPDLKFISYLQNLYFEFLVLLSNLKKIKSLSLSLLESGESFKKFLFLLSNLEK